MLRPIVFFQILAVANAAAPFTSGFPPPPSDWGAQAIPPPSGNVACNPIANQTYGTQAGQNSSGLWNFYASTPTGAASPQYFGGMVNPNTYYQNSGPGSVYGGQFQQSLPFNARLLSTQDLYQLSGGVCSFIPDYAEDTFSTPDLNLYNWFPYGSYPYNIPNTNVPGNISTYNPVYAVTGNTNYKSKSQIYTPWANPNSVNAGNQNGQVAGVVTDHCPSAGAVGAAGPGVCTSLQPGNLQVNVDLSPYGYKPTDASGRTTGAIYTLSHSNGATINPDGSNSLNSGCAYAPYPCTPGQYKDYLNTKCPGATGSALATCKTNYPSANCPTTQIYVCPIWGGSHLASQFCPQYGVLETEAAFNMPVAGGAYAFFGTYMYGTTSGNIASTTGATWLGDGSWNEIDELIFNGTDNGLGPAPTNLYTGNPLPTYGTALFVSKQPYPSNPWGNSQGYGSLSAAGLFSNHDNSGTCTGAGGSAACSASACPTVAWGALQLNGTTSSCGAAPMACPTPQATALASGMPASVAGGQGCPTYLGSTMQTFHNYKLIWTPDWLAWMIDNKVMRNESLAYRNQGALPWRPVQLKPLIRTNIGTSPTLSGVAAAYSSAIQCLQNPFDLMSGFASAPTYGACSSQAQSVYTSTIAGQLITVPMATIFNVGLNLWHANHTIQSGGTIYTCTNTNAPNGLGYPTYTTLTTPCTSLFNLTISATAANTANVPYYTAGNPASANPGTGWTVAQTGGNIMVGAGYGQIGSTTVSAGSNADYIASQTQCNPCGLISNPNTVAYFINVPMTNVYSSFLPDSKIYIRRMKYQALTAASLNNALTQANSWSPSTSVNAVCNPSPAPAPPPPLATQGAVLNYGNQPCYNSLSNCNTYSLCNAYGATCTNTSDTTITATCTTGSANALTSYSTPQYVCDYFPALYDSAASAQGQLCYGSSATCLNDPTNPCSSANPCVMSAQLCGSGYSLASGNMWTCAAFIGATSVQLASGTPPSPALYNNEIFVQGNGYFCYTSESACEVDDALNGCSPAGSGGPTCRNDTTASFCVGGTAASNGATWWCPTGEAQIGSVVSNDSQSLGELCFNSSASCSISGSNACGPSHPCINTGVALTACPNSGTTAGYQYYCDLQPLVGVASPPNPNPPSPPPPAPPPYATQTALPDYSQQLCYTNLADCNLFQATCKNAIAAAGANASTGALANGTIVGCIDQSTSSVVTCTTGLANSATNFGRAQYVCDLDAQQYEQAPGASGQICYPTVATCNSDPTNPCTAAIPCTIDKTLCGSGFAEGLGYTATCNSLAFDINGNTVSYPETAYPQGNQYLCYTSQSGCEGDVNSGCSSSGTRCVDDMSSSFCIGGAVNSVSPSASWYCPYSLQVGSVANTAGQLCFNNATSCANSGSNPCGATIATLPITVTLFNGTVIPAGSTNVDLPCMVDTTQCTTAGYSYYCSVYPALDSPPPPAPPPPAAPTVRYVAAQLVVANVTANQFLYTYQGPRRLALAISDALESAWPDYSYPLVSITGLSTVITSSGRRRNLLVPANANNTAVSFEVTATTITAPLYKATINGNTMSFLVNLQDDFLQTPTINGVVYPELFTTITVGTTASIQSVSALNGQAVATSQVGGPDNAVSSSDIDGGLQGSGAAAFFTNTSNTTCNCYIDSAFNYTAWQISQQGP